MVGKTGIWAENPCLAVNIPVNHSNGAAMPQFANNSNRCRNAMGTDSAKIEVTASISNTAGEMNKRWMGRLQLDTDSEFDDPIDGYFEIFDGAAGVVS